MFVSDQKKAQKFDWLTLNKPSLFFLYFLKVIAYET